MLGNGPRCKVLGDNFFSANWSDATTGNILDTIIIIMKRKEKPTGWWHAKNTHLCKHIILSRIFKHMVLVDYSYQSKKKYQDLFIYLSRNSFASFLYSSPPGHVGLPATICIYVVGLLPVNLNILFLFWSSEDNGSNSKLSLLWLHNLEKVEIWRYKCNRVYCIHVPGHDPLILLFPVLFLFDWVGVLWPQLSKVLKVVCWASSIPFPPVSLQRQVVSLLLRPLFMCSSQGRACK